MRTDIKILLIVSLVLLNGCTAQEKHLEDVSPTYINEETKKHINSTKVVVSLDQDKRLGIPASGLGTSHQYFGVIGKLAESAKIRFESDLSEEHYQLLRGVDKVAFRFNTGAKFRETIESNLRPIDWLNVSSVINQTDLQISDIEHMVRTQDEDALLLIDTRYLMAVDFSNITVFSYVTLYAHEEALVKIAKAARPYEDPPTLYNNLFSYVFRYDGSYTTADDALKGWDRNEAEMVKRAISESITDLTKQIAADMSVTTSD